LIAFWGDEFCKWREPQAALDNALMAMRLGSQPRMLLTTTPRNIPALKQLLEAPDVAVTRGRTSDNHELPADFYLAMKARYGATALGRQELDGELIADQEGALWRRGCARCRTWSAWWWRLIRRPAARAMNVELPSPVAAVPVAMCWRIIRWAACRRRDGRRG
jgi:phage terminase large subunit-like protein